MDIFKGLNPKQKEAVKNITGPLLILAGAGSGKTKVLTHRLAYLISQGVSDKNILAVTFTNKAADEMKERALKMVERKHHFPFLGTFHSIAARLLRSQLNNTDYAWDQNFVIYDQNDSLSLIKSILRESDELDVKKASKVQYFIFKNKQDRVLPENLPQNNFWLKQVKPVYKKYQARLKKNNSLDFDDLLLVLVQMLEDYPEIKKYYLNKFKHILIDEYQDTNLLQYQMVNLLINKSQNLMVVGDDWQAIYGFRGADFTNILNFKKDYPQAKVIKLEQNYRSSKHIIQGAQSVIENNRDRSEKKLWTEAEKGEPIQIIRTTSGEEEAQAVVRMIEELGEYDQTAILYRTHAQSRLLEETLIQKSVPYQIVGGTSFYERKEVKDILSYLHLAWQDNSVHLDRVINTPRRGIGQKTQERLENKDWQLDKVDHPRFQDFKRILNELRILSKKKTVDQLAHWLINKINYQKHLKDYAQTEDQAQARWENVEELISVAAKFSQLKPRESLKNFLQETSLMDLQDRLDDESETLSLMTLHTVKGLEFRNVFIVGLEEGLLPHEQSLMADSEIEEERRLCYVGMTRAEKRLYLSQADQRMIHGRLNSNEPSRFLEEIPDEVIESRKELNQIQTFKDNKAKAQKEASRVDIKLSKGTQVKHFKLGVGRVVSVDDNMVEVDFPKLGRKKLSLEYAPLEKVS